MAGVGEAGERVVGDLPEVTVGVSEVAGAAAPEDLLRWLERGGAGERVVQMSRIMCPSSVRPANGLWATSQR